MSKSHMASSNAVSRIRRLAASTSVVGGAAYLFFHARASGWLSSEIIAFVALLGLAGVGLSRRGVLTQVLARGATWLLALPMLAMMIYAAFHGRTPDATVITLAASTGTGLFLARPMLHTEDARAEFAPVRFRRWLLGAGAMAIMTSLGTAMAAYEVLVAHQWSAGLYYLAMTASLIASAVSVVRMRAWGIFLGALTCVAALVPMLWTHDAFSRFLLGMTALPGALLVLPIVLARLGVGTRVDQAPETTRVRVAALADSSALIRPETSPRVSVAESLDEERAEAPYSTRRATMLSS